MKKCLMIVCMLICFANIVFAWSEDDSAASFADCLACHQEYNAFPASDMPTKHKEKAFIDETFGKTDPDFEAKNCAGCHVTSCLSCHKDRQKPSIDVCIECHNDLYTGIEYIGLGIREDHERYQRGPERNGKNYMKMLPDVHFAKGLICADCHSMKSFTDRSLIKQCIDCHNPSKNVIDHEITAHANVKCVSCHAAWAPIEYGAFYVRFVRSDTLKGYFRGVRQLSDEYMKSSFMRINAPFALGKDEAGMYTPIRPRMVFFTYNRDENPIGAENVMLSGRWEMFTPHTVRRETVLCESCHTDRRRYLLELPQDSYFMLRKDGLKLQSFWNSQLFTLQKGAFVTEEEFADISRRSPVYVRYYLRKLEQVKKVVR